MKIIGVLMITIVAIIAAYIVMTFIIRVSMRDTLNSYKDDVVNDEDKHKYMTG